MKTTTADQRTPRLVVALVLASILVGVAGAQDAPRVDDLLTAIARGDADAQWHLGDAYHYGRGVTQDDAEALRMYRAAAEQDSSAGQWRLGNVYFHGWEVTRDYADAARWYRAASEQGSAEGQWRLGSAYYFGAGIAQGLRRGGPVVSGGGGAGQRGASVATGHVVRHGPRRAAGSRGGVRVAQPRGCAGPREQGAAGRDGLAESMTAEQVAEAQRMARELWGRIEGESPAAP